jgi:hypothetical protein
MAGTDMVEIDMAEIDTVETGMAETGMVAGLHTVARPEDQRQVIEEQDTED